MQPLLVFRRKYCILFVLTYLVSFFSFVVLVVQKNLEVGETLSVDMSCIVALPSTVNVQIKYNGPMRRVVFGVTSLFFSSVITHFYFSFSLLFNSLIHKELCFASSILLSKIEISCCVVVFIGGESSNSNVDRTWHCLYSEFTLPPAFSAHC